MPELLSRQGGKHTIKYASVFVLPIPQTIKKFPAPALTCAPQPPPFTETTNPAGGRLAWVKQQGETLRMWNNRQGGKDGAIIPFVFPSLSRQRRADSTTRVWQPHNGAAGSGSGCRRPGNPCPPPQSRPATGGPKAAMPNDICRFRFQPAPGRPPARPHARPRPRPARPRPRRPQPRSRHGLQARGRLGPRPPVPSRGLRGRDKAARARPAALSGPGRRPGVRPGTRPPRGRPGKELLLRGAPGPPLPERAQQRRSDGARQRAPTPAAPHPGTGAARSSPSARGSRRAHAARTRAHAPAPSLTRAAHSPRPGPSPVPRNSGRPAPGKGPTQFTVPQPQLGRSGTGPPRPVGGGRGVPEAAHPGGPPARPGFPSTARSPCARPRHQAGRKGRRRDWGWHWESGTGAPPSPPPPATRHHLFCSTKGCRRNRRPRATYRRLSASPPPPRRRPRSRRSGRERLGAAARRPGQRPPAEPAGDPLRSHRPQRQQPPGAGPAPAPARLPALLRLQRRGPSAEPASRAPPAARRRAGPPEEGATAAR